MLLKSFGEYWNPATVEWENKQLLGEAKIRRKKRTIDFWHARGVYVLYSDFKAIYVGKSEDSIGNRLNAHLTDRFAGRWDMFSWFSTDKPNVVKGNVNAAKGRGVKVSEMVKTFESILIVATAPALNRKYESIPGAIQFEQLNAHSHRSMRQYFEEVLSRLP
jgi:hypothetical protein